MAEDNKKWTSGPPRSADGVDMGFERKKSGGSGMIPKQKHDAATRCSEGDPEKAGFGRRRGASVRSLERRSAEPGLKPVLPCGHLRLRWHLAPQSLADVQTHPSLAWGRAQRQLVLAPIHPSTQLTSLHS